MINACRFWILVAPGDTLPAWFGPPFLIGAATVASDGEFRLVECHTAIHVASALAAHLDIDDDVIAYTVEQIDGDDLELFAD